MGSPSRRDPGCPVGATTTRPSGSDLPVAVQPHPEVDEAMWSLVADHPQGETLARSAGTDASDVLASFRSVRRRGQPLADDFFGAWLAEAESIARRRHDSVFATTAVPCNGTLVRHARIVSFLIGIAIVVYVIEAAVRTVVLPRASRPSLSARRIRCRGGHDEVCGVAAKTLRGARTRCCLPSPRSGS